MVLYCWSCRGYRLGHYAVIRGVHGFRIDVDNQVMFICCYYIMVGLTANFPPLYASLHIVCVLFQLNTPPPQPLYGPFSGTTRVSRCQKKASSGRYGARENNKRQTHQESGWAPLHPDQSAIYLHQSPIFMPDAFPATTLLICPGLGQAQ